MNPPAHDSRQVGSGSAHSKAPGAWEWRFREGWLLVVAAVFVCALICSALVAFTGDDLDLEALIPGQGQPEGFAMTSAPTATEDDEVRVVLTALVVVTAVPLLAPRRAFRYVLVCSTACIGLFVGLTILHLGAVFIPVLALQVLAIIWAFPALRDTVRAGGSHRDHTEPPLGTAPGQSDS